MRSDLCKLLDTGDPFPLLEFPLVRGGTVSLPGAFNGHWNVFLIYRGHW
jgi:vacuolar-type H+-ATPase catalytic subunit A/Vma1